MNTSLQDGYNIGWKLATVLLGRAGPELLQTYNLELQKVAADLIDFGRYFTKLFLSSAGQDDISPEHFAEQFTKSARYNADLTVIYNEFAITSADHGVSILASNIVVGMRFLTTQVMRFCDAKPTQLIEELKSDKRWQIVIFTGDIRLSSAVTRLQKLADYLQDGPVKKFTVKSAGIESFIESLVVLLGDRLRIEQEQIPDFFSPITGKWKIRDLHKTFIDDVSYNSSHGHAYQMYGIDPERGAILIVRPDQYVSKIISFERLESIGEFFEGWALPQ